MSLLWANICAVGADYIPWAQLVLEGLLPGLITNNRGDSLEIGRCPSRAGHPATFCFKVYSELSGRWGPALPTLLSPSPSCVPRLRAMTKPCPQSILNQGAIPRFLFLKPQICSAFAGKISKKGIMSRAQTRHAGQRKLPSKEKQGEGYAEYSRPVTPSGANQRIGKLLLSFVSVNV